MFPWSNKPAAPSAFNSLMVPKCQATPSVAPLFLTAAKFDTDHSVGSGSVAVTGKYDSKKDSFGVDFAYAPDDNNTLYATYAVTDEKLTGVGIESGFSLSEGYKGVMDAMYIPPSDSARVKVSVRHGKTKFNSYMSFSNVSAAPAKPAVKLEVDSKFSSKEGIKMGYDINTKSAKLKYGRKLDPKNKLDAEYVYVHEGGKSFAVKLAHTQNKNHSFSAAFNYGSKKIAAEWEWRTDNGPWTVNANIPFNASPTQGDWSIKRRFEL